MFREEEALEICEEVVREKGFAINILGAKKEDERIVFLFSTAGDKNQLKKLSFELHRVLNTDVELRKIETRERAKQLGGLGKCGRTLCCATWLGKSNSNKFEKIKDCDTLSTGENNLGSCGKPVCCLFYLKENWLEEQEQQQKDNLAERKKETKEQEKEEASPEKKEQKKKPKRRVRKLKI